MPLNPQSLSSEYFTTGFEKTAILGLVGRAALGAGRLLGRMGGSIGKKLTGKVVDGKWQFKPGKALMSGFVGMEAADAASKTMDATRRMRHIGNPNRMNGMGMQNLPGHTNVQRGLN